MWGLPRKIVINRRVADLERATFITRVTFVALPLFLSLSVCHPPLKAANCIYELSGRNGWFAEPLARILHRPIVGWENVSTWWKLSRLFEVDDNGFTQSKRANVSGEKWALSFRLSSSLHPFVSNLFLFSPTLTRFALFFRCICLRFVETAREGEGGWSRRSQRLYPFSLLIADSYRCLDLSVENAWRII